MFEGCVYLVGAGPGDPGLITVRGLELLSRADVVVYDRLVSPRLISSAPRGAELIYVGKEAGRHSLSQDEINDLLVSRARSGASVVRLKGGDPFIFGRGGEEALAVVAAGIELEVVPGVTAAGAASACAGIPLTHRATASAVGLVTGHETPDKEAADLNYHALANWKGTLAFYMGVANLDSICRRLEEHGLNAETPSAVIRWGATPRQQVVAGSLRTLAKLAREAGITPPAMVIIGDVVRLRKKLAWFERRPLFSQRIVVTRASAQAQPMTEKLERLGAEVIEMPAIRIEPADDDQPLRRAILALESFDWIVFTSANAVDAFFAALAAMDLDSRALGTNRICTIGPATADRLAGFGIRPDAQPEQFVTSRIAAAIAAAAGDLAGLRILCPRSDVAPRDLTDALAERKAEVHAVTAYRTVADCSGADRVAKMLDERQIQWITFTSPSTVRSFFGAIPPDKVRSAGARLASIGPVTSAALAELGLRPAVQADCHTVAGLTDAILVAGSR